MTDRQREEAIKILDLAEVKMKERWPEERLDELRGVYKKGWSVQKMAEWFEVNTTEIYYALHML